MLLFPFSSSLIFHILTCLSVPPVTIHPFTCGLTSMDDTAPSCADRVKRDGDGLSRLLGRVRISKLRTMPFSKETYKKRRKLGMFVNGKGECMGHT